MPESSVKVPILMYHSVSGRDESASHPYFRVCTDVSTFATQMQFLKRSGYNTIGLNRAVELIRAGVRTPEKSVVITFDDGFEDFYTQAAPILDRFGYTATVFLPTAFIGQVRRGFKGTPCLTWAQVRELQGRGIEFGSHTVNHPQLSTLSLEAVRDEVRCSKAKIEDELGSAVSSFAYPYAFPETATAFRQALREILQESGYRCGVSTIIGTAGPKSDPYFLERLPVNSCDDGSLLGAKLDGAYDWVHTLQTVTKLRKRRPKSLMALPVEPA